MNEREDCKLVPMGPCHSNYAIIIFVSYKEVIYSFVSFFLKNKKCLICKSGLNILQHLAKVLIAEVSNNTCRPISQIFYKQCFINFV